jgi:hypothetical protein
MSALAPLPAREPEDTPVDQEALIKEARRRARRRRAAFAGAALAALGTALGIFFSTGGPRAPHSGRPRASGALPQAGSVVGTLPISPQETVEFAARNGTLVVLVIEPGRAHSISVVRVDRGETTTRERVRFDLADYLSDISAGPGGIYAGTAVIKRFTSARDELIRIDPITLTIRARAFFPASVAGVAYGSWVWAALGDGRVVRLDPRTLSIEASQRILSAAAAANFVALLSKPAFGLGNVWVLAGNARHLELVRMDPTTLAIRSRTRVPTGGTLAQQLHEIAGDSGHVYLVGGAVVAVSANGKLTNRPVLVPGLANAGINGTGLVGVTAEPPGLVLLDPRGRIEARTSVADAGGQLAVSGREVWFLGNAGQGNGLVHFRVRRR